jgi:hypothetical protein
MMAVGWRAGWQLQRGRVEQRHRHGVRARARRRIEQPPHRHVLDVDRAHQQQPGVVVGPLLGADGEDLERERLVVLAGGPGARQQRVVGRGAIEGLDAGT